MYCVVFMFLNRSAALSGVFSSLVGMHSGHRLCTLSVSVYLSVSLSVHLSESLSVDLSLFVLTVYQHKLMIILTNIAIAI